MPTLTEASRRAPSLSTLTEDKIIQGSRPEEEVPGKGIDLLESLASRKRPKIQVTPLHVNIPVPLDNALRTCMRTKGLEKTEIVVEALTNVLRDFLG